MRKLLIFFGLPVATIVAVAFSLDFFTNPPPAMAQASGPYTLYYQNNYDMGACGGWINCVDCENHQGLGLDVRFRHALTGEYLKCAKISKWTGACTTTCAGPGELNGKPCFQHVGQSCIEQYFLRVVPADDSCPSSDPETQALCNVSHGAVVKVLDSQGKALNVVPITVKVYPPPEKTVSGKNCFRTGDCPCGAEFNDPCDSCGINENHGHTIRGIIWVLPMPDTFYWTELQLEMSPKIGQVSPPSFSPSWGTALNIVKDIKHQVGFDLGVTSALVKVWYRPYVCTGASWSEDYTSYRTNCYEEEPPRFVTVNNPNLLATVSGSFGDLTIPSFGLPQNYSWKLLPVTFKRDSQVKDGVYNPRRANLATAFSVGASSITFNYKVIATGRVTLPCAFATIDASGRKQCRDYEANYYAERTGSATFPVFYATQTRSR